MNIILRSLHRSFTLLFAFIEREGEMSKWGKRKDEEEYSEGDAPVSKVAKKDTGDDSDSEDIVVCQVSLSLSLSLSTVVSFNIYMNACLICGGDFGV